MPFSGAIGVLVEPDTRDFPRKLESGLKGVTGVAGKVGKGIAVAMAGATLAAGAGFGALIQKGNEYQASLNELQSVSQATGLDMARVGAVAKQLGADMTLPATSAADAASAMVGLAKGGLDVGEAMDAAKGTLQLAAAAQIDGATAAEIQAGALNAFGLSAGQAGRVADVLANTANAAAGSMVDIGNSLKYVAPVAAALKVPLEATAAAIGLLANQGVKGEQAGTSLRGILASLASPSKLAAEGLKTLGVQAFDTQGRFVGLRAFTDQLAQAKKRLTDAEFAAAASTAFGNEGLTAANALAAEGTAGFDAMAQSVSRAGGAADVAAAQTKGLGGAVEGFKSQVETAGIEIYEVIAPNLEKVVRAGADFVAEFTPTIVDGLETAVAAGELFGPGLADALRSRGAVVGDAVEDVLAPLARASLPVLNTALNTSLALWDDFTDVLADAVAGAKPVAAGIAEIVESATDAGGPVSAVATGLELAGNAAAGAANVLRPLGAAVGVLASGFAALPGPIQTAAVAMGLLVAFRDKLSGVGDKLTTRLIDPFRRMGDEIKLQQALYDGASGSIGKFSGAMAALESRVPAVGAAFGAARSAGSAYAATYNTITQATDRFALSAGVAVESIGRIPDAVVSAGRSITGFGSTITGLATSARVGLSLAADQVRATTTDVVNSVRAIPTAVGVAALSMQDRLVGAARSVGDAFTALPGKIALLPTAVGVGVIGTLERIPGAVTTSVAALGKFGGAVAGATAAAGSLAKSAGSGLVAALGGPWGAAITGASAALALLSSRQDEAARKANEHKARVQSLTDAFVESKGAITDSIRQDQLKAAQNSDLLEVTERLGISQKTLSDALLGNRDAIGLVNRAFDEFGITMGGTTGVFASALDTFRGIGGENELGGLARVAVAARGSFGELTTGLLDSRQEAARLSEAVSAGSRSMLETSDAGRTLSDSMGVLRDTTASADDRARALKDALDALSGGQISLEATQARLNEQLDRLKQTFGENIDKAKGWGAALLNADGSINTTTENGRRLLEGLRDISGSMAEVAQKTFDVARAQGDDMPTALAKATAAAQSARDGFIAQYEALGLTAEQAAALATKYDLLPELVATLIQTPGMTQAQAEMVVIKGLIDKVPPDKPIVVRSLSDEAKKKLEELGFTVRTLPDGQVQITANTAGAKAELEGFIARSNGRIITIYGRVVYDDSGPSRSTRGGLTMAEGGIVATAYAHGAVRRLTPMAAGIADIAPAGSWRIIGDRAKGDEFYLPDDDSARSMAIASEWARRQGLMLVDAFVAGASRTVSTGSSGDGGGVTVQNLNVRTLNERLRLRDVQEELYYQGLY